MRVGNKNKLTETNRQKIDAFTARKDIVHFTKLVETLDLATNGYNIAGVVVRRASRQQRGGICAQRKIAGIVTRQAELRAQIDADAELMAKKYEPD
ncbi:MAG: hypothetical protein U1F20_01910 [Lysobacterales bacterium]